MKNNVPRYVIMEISQFHHEELAALEDVESIGRRILEKNRHAFEELAK